MPRVVFHKCFYLFDEPRTLVISTEKTYWGLQTQGLFTQLPCSCSTQGLTWFPEKFPSVFRRSTARIEKRLPPPFHTRARQRLRLSYFRSPQKIRMSPFSQLCWNCEVPVSDTHPSGVRSLTHRAIPPLYGGGEFGKATPGRTIPYLFWLFSKSCG